VESHDAARYGQTHASVYDRIYGARFDPGPAVTALAAAAGGGAVLELGLGTGRLAIPLTHAGVPVDGIEASDAMIARLRAEPGGDRVGVLQTDLANFDLPRHNYHVAVCAVSTLFMLGHDAQRTCLNAVARHLRPGGRLFIEAFVPDPSRFDADGRRTERRPPAGGSHTVTSRHDPSGHRIHVVHTLTDPHGHRADYQVTLHYETPAELDAMASAAGLHPAGRWGDWTGRPADAHSHDPISVYIR
jgi:SAM-dependent methyltransferase